MSRKHLPVLAIALVVVLGILFLLLPGQTGRETLDGSSALLEGLDGEVNDVNRVTVVGAGEAVVATLVRGDGAWRIEEFAGYPADMAVVREVLGGLARASVIEAKTDNPDYYARLGVEDVGDAAAGGLRLDIEVGEERTWSVIVGDEAPNRGGHYLREAGEAGSVLADFEADVPADAAGWADTTVVDLLAAEVAEVQLRHPDGETVTARKVSADETDFTLLELPDGREIKSAWSVNSLGSALSTLDFESVQPVDAVDWSAAIAFRALRFDGLEVRGELLRDETLGDWLRLEAVAPEAVEASEQVPLGETDDIASGEDAAARDPAEAAAEALENAAPVNPAIDAAANLNARVGGWAYQVPGYKADALAKRLEELLKEPGSEEGGTP